MSYPQLNKALLKRYNLTEDGYREKFRKCKPEQSETIEQLIFCVKTYLEKWMELSRTEATYEGLRDLFVKEPNN